MKLAILTLYIVTMIVVGYVGLKRTRTVTDFFLANRRVGPWLSAFAYGSTYFSAVLFIGYAGKIGWGFGISSLWIVAGNAILGSLLAWLVLARRTRQITRELNVRTLPEFLEARYHSPLMKPFAAVLIFVFLVPYSASAYMGLSYLFEHVFGIGYVTALIVMTVVTGVYLVMGGYFSVALSDLIQGLFMIGGVFVLLFYVLVNPTVGGFTNLIKGLAEVDPRLAGPVGPPGWMPMLFLVLLTSLGPWGLPQMIQKYYAIKDDQSVRAGTVIATLFAALITFGAYFTGAASRLFFQTVPLEAGRPNPDLIIPQLIVRILPDAAASLILVLVLAASMSTLSSLVLVASSAVAIDLVGTGGTGTASGESGRVLLMRLLCVLFLVCSLAIALTKPAVILSLMALSWGTLAGAFLGPYLYGLYRPRAGKLEAWVGMITGLLISLVLSFAFKLDAGKTPMASTFAMIVPLLLMPVVGRLIPEGSVTKEPAAVRPESTD